MKTFKSFITPIKEDAMAVGPVNTAGSGAVAAIGQPPGSRNGEPGGKKKVLITMGKRNPPKM